MAIAAVLVAACGDDGGDRAEVAGVSVTPSTTSTTASITTTTSEPAVLGFGEEIPIPAREGDTGKDGEPIPAASAVAVSARGVVAVGSQRGVLRLVDTGGTVLDVPEEAHDGAITAVAFVGTGDDLLTAGEDGRAVRWTRVATREWTSEDAFAAPGGRAFKALAVSPDGSYAATGGIDQAVRLWDLASGEEEADWNAARTRLEGAVIGLAFSPDWQLDGAGAIAATTAAGLAYLVTASGAGSPVVVADGSATSPAFVPDGQGLAVAGADRPWILSVPDGRGAPLESAPVAAGPVTAVAARPGQADPVVLATGHQGSGEGGVTSVVHVFDHDRPDRAVTYDDLSSDVVALAFTSTGDGLVVAAADEVFLLPLLAE
jgi:WD40 repeat protein